MIYPSIIIIITQLKTKRSSVESLYKRNDRRIKAVRMLFVVTVSFFLLWTPFIIMRIVTLSGRRIDSYLYKFSEILVRVRVRVFIFDTDIHNTKSTTCNKKNYNSLPHISHRKNEIF